ncbi:MAG TPA: hypothetical protein VK572_04880 [Burkholderiales bacterium]|nr:hypothetical protein [Burkholderiales bacterium]
MKYSKLFVAGAAAFALGGCYSVPVDSSSPQGVSAPAPVGYNSSPGSSNTTVGTAGDTKPDGTGTYETRAKGNTEDAAK